MANVQVRIPKDLLNGIEDIVKSSHTTRSEVIRRLLYEGYKKELLDNTLKKYQNEEITLCKAAELADVSVSEFAEYASKKDIPFMRYSREEAEEDLQRLSHHESSS